MKDRIFKVYANDINKFTNKPRQTKIYITIAGSEDEAVDKAKLKHYVGEWRFSATVVEDDLHLIDGWQE